MEPSNETKKLRDAKSTVTPESLSETTMKRGNREDLESQQINIKNDEARRERKSTSDKTESLHSSQAVIHQFSPSSYAQGGANVVNPAFIGSKVDTVNITINQQGQGSVNHEASSQPKYEKITECKQKLRDQLKSRFSYLHEGRPGKKKTCLNSFFIEPDIIEGGSGEVNKEHEVRQIETVSCTHVTEEKSIHCNQLFIPTPGQDIPIRTVITRGVAGIGKTMSANKFTLDWAEERENTNLDFVFPVPFEDLNKMKEKTLSFVELLNVLFPDTKGSEIFSSDEHKMLFIFDGLDESQLPLDFDNSEIVTDVTQPTPVNVLLINIIRRRLLPSALVWITSRPVASSQIPLEYIDLVIDMQGFNNSQKDEYFRKKIGDQDLAKRVIKHVESSITLYIMCHLPFFCWMLATPLEKKLAKMDGKDTPKSLTLTPIYIQHLIFYVDNMKRKRPGTQSSNECVRADILSLGKLAFEKLENDPSTFDESDLIQNEIQVSEPSMLSGIYTQIFSEELILFQEKMFSFVHLSVQEFFAALYVYITFKKRNVNVLITESCGAESSSSEVVSELNLFKAAVEMALQCESGHYDIFLRFLSGLSLETNQKMLQHLMSNKTNKETRAEIIKHIKEKFRASPPSERRQNLIHCLQELDDHSLQEEI